MSKSMISPEAVLQMNHAEAASWLDSILDSLGIKKTLSKEESPGTIISQRLKKPSEKK